MTASAAPPGDDDGVELAPRRRGRSVRLKRGLRWLGSTLLTSCITLVGLLVVTFALGRVLPSDPVLRVAEGPLASGDHRA